MNKFLVSRTDSIGDVVLSLPVAGWLKKKFPDSKVIFLGKSYTCPIINRSTFVDEVWDKDDLTNLNEADCLALIREEGFTAVIHLFPDT